jgi:hypothetical protein
LRSTRRRDSPPARRTRLRSGSRRSPRSRPQSIGFRSDPRSKGERT